MVPGSLKNLKNYKSWKEASDPQFFNNSHNFSTIRRNHRKLSQSDKDVDTHVLNHVTNPSANHVTYEIEQKIFEIVDFWSFHFTGDLHFPESLHLVMEILEKLRNKNQVWLILQYIIWLILYESSLRRRVDVGGSSPILELIRFALNNPA